MRVKFDIQYREEIESGEYTVETEDGHPVRIICWDTMMDWPICGLIKDYNPKSTYAYPQLFDEYGTCIKEKGKDLFVCMPTPELNGFEETYLRVVHKLSPTDILPKFIEQNNLRENCKELLDSARKQLSKEFDAQYMKGFLEGKESVGGRDLIDFNVEDKKDG